MCSACYEEAGCPVPQQAARDLAPRLNDCNPFGGCHIVVEDWNVEDNHIDYCLNDKHTTEFEAAVMRDLKKLPVDQRYAAMAVAHDVVS